MTPKVGPSEVLDEDHDDEENDPDYVYNEYETVLDVQDEFNFNRSTKISQKECDEMLNDVFLAYNLDEKEQKEKSAEKSKTAKISEEFCEESEKPNFYYPNYSYNFDLSGEQRSVINQQMRQHIQLLTQMSLLTSKDMQWNELHKDCRHMLNEVYSRSSGYSVYNQVSFGRFWSVLISLVVFGNF